MTTKTMGQEFELKAIFTTQKSFGNKATVKIEENEKGKYIMLFSYHTFIIELKELENGEKIINAFTDNDKHLTPVTCRHLNEFALQNGLGSKTKKQWLEILENTVNNDY